MTEKDIALASADEIDSHGNARRTIAGGEIERHEFKDRYISYLGIANFSFTLVCGGNALD